MTADFPHDTRFAYTVVDSKREKYEACTEREKREITRSDIEFIYIIMSAVALRCGFKNIKDCFDIDESTLNIPKIPRGKELFWSELGDPDPEVSEEDKMLHSKIEELVSEIVNAFHDLYPEMYSKIRNGIHW